MPKAKRSVSAKSKPKRVKSTKPKRVKSVTSAKSKPKRVKSVTSAKSKPKRVKSVARNKRPKPGYYVVSSTKDSSTGKILASKRAYLPDRPALHRPRPNTGARPGATYIYQRGEDGRLIITKSYIYL